MATVAQLIDRLREFPPEMEVRVAVENPYGSDDHAIPIEQGNVRERAAYKQDNVIIDDVTRLRDDGVAIIICVLIDVR